MEVSFELNGAATQTDAPAERRVIDLLREDLALTGTKEGCGTGECGACTILIDGEARLACLTLVGQITGARLVTVEGLALTHDGAAIQQAFGEQGAVQCGFCIPGMEMAALALLRKDGQASRDTIREGLSGNLCRCTGYVKIIDAVESAEHTLRCEEDR
jgi:carbon-monoxide dehydrogenase small subunit